MLKVLTLRHPAKPVTIDGKLDEWDMDNAAIIQADAGRGGRAMIAYDEKYLYVAYRVADDSPFVNAGKDIELLFKTGDLVDLILSTDPTADPRRTAGKGDLRLLFAPWQGKPVVVLNQKVADGGPKAPYRFVSPTGFEDYERVTVLHRCPHCRANHRRRLYPGSRHPVGKYRFYPTAGETIRHRFRHPV